MAPERPDWCLGKKIVLNDVVFSKSIVTIFSICLHTEYDDGDGEHSHDNSYSSAEQQSTTPAKRRLENGLSSNELDDTANDEDDAKDGESSTSAEGVPKKKRRKEFLNLNATFMAGIQGVKLVIDQVCRLNHFILLQKMSNNFFFSCIFAV